MPRIKPEDRTPVEAITIRLRRDLIDRLSAYATFLEDSSLNYVVSTVLAEALDGDREFAKWLADHPDALRRHSIRRGRSKAQSVAA